MVAEAPPARRRAGSLVVGAAASPHAARNPLAARKTATNEERDMRLGRVVGCWMRRSESGSTPGRRHLKWPANVATSRNLLHSDGAVVVPSTRSGLGVRPKTRFFRPL